MIEQNFFKRRKKQQHISLLTGVPHQPNTPQFALYWTEPAGNLDVKFVQELLPHSAVVHSCRNLYSGYRD